MNKRFSIAIVHRNGFSKLYNMLESLIEDAREKDEIFVVDNNSEDGSLEKIQQIQKFKNILFIKNSCNAGYGHACNQVMDIAQGKFYLLCNNDLQFQKGTLDKFEKFLNSNKSFGMIGPQLLSPDGAESVSYSTKKIDFLSHFDFIGRPIKQKKLKKFSEVFSLRGACLAVKKELVSDIGYFDEDFYFYHEDTEWSRRVSLSLKWKLGFCPEIKVRHIGGASSKNLFYQSRIEFYRSRIIFWKKIFNKPQFFIIFTWNFFKLFLDLTFYSLMSLLTFGRINSYNKKVIDRFVVITWIIFGMNKKWGLPDKCHFK